MSDLIPQSVKDNWQRGTEATYWDGEQLRTAAAHEPRIQTDPETGERYLLAEPQRTNRENMGFTRPVDGFSLTPGFVDPSGGTGAYEAEVTDKNNSRIVISSFGSEKGRHDSVSVFVKAGSYSGDVALKMGAGNFHNAEVRVNLGNGELSIVRDDTIVQHKALGPGPNGWIRILLSSLAPGTTGGAKTAPLDQRGAENGDTFYVFGPQSEKGAAYASSFIYGGGGTTRAPDDLSDLPFSMASGAKSVYFRISQQANAYAPNDGGNVTNAEVNLTDTPGVVGGGLLRPSTGIVGVAANGEIREVVNTSDEDLQGNSTSDAVDGLTIQPDKSPSTDGAIYKIKELVAWEEERTYDERRSLTSQRPQPWQELDPPSIAALNAASPWDVLGFSEPPHWHIDVPNKVLPETLKSACDRSTEGYYWDGTTVRRAAPGKLRVRQFSSEEKSLHLTRGGTNYLPYSADATQWSQVGANGVTFSSVSSVFENAGSESLISPQELTPGGDTADGVKQTFTQNPGVPVLFCIFETGTSDESKIEMYDSGSLEIEITLDWAAESFSGTQKAAIWEKVGQGPNGGDLWFVVVQSAQFDNSPQSIQVIPDSASGSGSLIQHFVGTGERRGTNIIVTGAGAKTEAEDRPKIPFHNFPGDVMTLMFDYSMFTVSSNNQNLLGSDFGYLRFQGGSSIKGFGNDRAIKSNTTGRNKVVIVMTGSESIISQNGSSVRQSYSSEVKSKFLQFGGAKVRRFFMWPEAITEAEANTFSDLNNSYF
jgi:hypothetical protein